MPFDGKSCGIFEECCVDDILFRATRAARATECRPLATLTSTERLNGEDGHVDDDDNRPKIQANHQRMNLYERRQ